MPGDDDAGTTSRPGHRGPLPGRRRPSYPDRLTRSAVIVSSYPVTSCRTATARRPFTAAPLPRPAAPTPSRLISVTSVMMFELVAPPGQHRPGPAPARAVPSSAPPRPSAVQIGVAGAAAPACPGPARPLGPWRWRTSRLWATRTIGSRATWRAQAGPRSAARSDPHWARDEPRRARHEGLMPPVTRPATWRVASAVTAARSRASGTGGSPRLALRPTRNQAPGRARRPSAPDPGCSGGASG